MNNICITQYKNNQTVQTQLPAELSCSCVLHLLCYVHTACFNAITQDLFTCNSIEFVKHSDGHGIFLIIKGIFLLSDCLTLHLIKNQNYLWFSLINLDPIFQNKKKNILFPLSLIDNEKLYAGLIKS